MANMSPIISANAVNPAAQTTRVIETARPVRNTQAEKPEVQQSKQPDKERAAERPEAAKPEVQERELDHVIAVSKDGDTVQASDEAVRELNEEETVGRVIGDPANEKTKAENGSESREELLELEQERRELILEAQLEALQEEHEERREEALEAEPNAVLADEKETIAEEGQINSFIGYSDAELERMYLQGNITQYDYDREMENRAAKEEAREEELRDFSLEEAGNVGERERSERITQELERAFSDNANERLDVQTREQLIRVMEDLPARQEDTDPNRVAPLTNFSLS